MYTPSLTDRITPCRYIPRLPPLTNVWTVLLTVKPGAIAKHRSMEMLQWGVSLEITPNVDLLWSLANAYIGD